eukprot:SAG31_NODE_24689_length_476_cov_0.989390_1_plen_23_part_10
MYTAVAAAAVSLKRVRAVRSRQ